MEVDWRNKLWKNRASSWFSLDRCTEMRGQQNIKLCYLSKHTLYRWMYAVFFSFLCLWMLSWCWGSGVSRPHGRPFLRIQSAVAGELLVMSEVVRICRPIPALCGHNRKYETLRIWASALYSSRAAGTSTMLRALRPSNVQTHNLAL